MPDQPITSPPWAIIEYEGSPITIHSPPCPHKSMTMGSSTHGKLICDDCHEILDPEKELKSFDNEPYCCTCKCHHDIK